MKKLNLKNKEVHFLVLFGLLALLFFSINLSKNITPQGTTYFEDTLPKSSAITIDIIYPSTNENLSATLPNFVVEFSGDPLNKSWYTLNTNQTKHFFTNNGTINGWQFLSDGVVNITFYSNNSLGVVYHNYVLVTRDTVNPGVPLLFTANPISWTNTDSFDLSWSNPVDTSGIIGAYYKLDLAPTSNTDGTYVPGIDIEAILGISVTTDGAHPVYVWLNDSAGNINYLNYNSTQLYLDTAAPSTPLLFGATPDSWTDTDNFELYWTNPSDDSGIVGAYYKLDSAPTSNSDGTYVPGIDIESILGISVTTDGIHDVYVWLNDSAGNINYLNYNSTQLYLDTAAPSAPLLFGATPDSWTGTDNFDLYWTNPSGGSGIIGAYYKLDSAPTSNSDGTYVPGIDIESILGISVTTDGIHDVYVWLNDSAGNINYLNYNSTQLYLDTAAPSAPLLFGATPDSWTGTDNFDLYWTNPSGGSGIIGAYYKLDSAPTSNSDGIYVAGVDIEAILGISVITDGVHTVYVWLNDSLGNINYLNYNSTQLYLDTTAPSTPLLFGATPVSWTNTDSFDLDWTNPSDDSGITGAYYKLDSAPTSNTDGTYVPGIDIESILGISVTSDGAHTVYVWLNDSVGNINYLSYNSTQLYLDTTAPSTPLLFGATPVSWTNTDSFDLYWTNPSDDSGITGAYYKLDSAPLNNTDGTYVPGIDIEAILGISVTSDGVHTVYVWLNDSAGNGNYLNYNSTQLYLDTTAPSTPLLFGATPVSWTNTDSFDLDWTNPSDDSGIAGAYYKLDSAPTSNTDGTYVAGTDIEAILGISVTSDGVHTVYVWLNDSLGNINYLNYVSTQLYLDTSAPSINIVSPGAGQTFGSQAPNFIVEIFDYNLHTMWYTFDGVTNFTFLVNDTVDYDEWTSLSNGPVSITFYANDSFGYTNSATQNFFKNADAPVIIILSPTPGSYHGTLAPNFTVEITDADLDTMWYSIDGGVTNNTFLTNGTINQVQWAALPFNEGVVSLIFYANDTLGNTASVLRLIYKDTVAPTINIVSPYLLELLGVNVPSFTVEIDDTILGTMWYSLDNGLNNYTFTTNTTFNQAAWNAVSNGTLTIFFYAIDLVGNEAFDSIVVRVDKITPTITVNLPVNDAVIGTQPTINITVEDTNVDSIWYRVGTTVIILPLSANNTDVLLNILIWNALSEGPFTIEFFANDTAGNLNSLYSVDLTKDIAAPTINIVHPLDNATYSTLPQITLTINDATLDTTWYTIVGTNYTFEFTAVLGTNVVTLDQAAWDALSNGDVVIIFYANDSLGRISSDSITIKRDVPIPFDFIAFLLSPIGITLMVSIVVIIVVLLLVRRRKFHKTSDKEVRKIESLWD
ncbi:MAG: hypothetical protein ACFE96_00520 [Candidatus Hermodarchaeota archaeon]